MSKNFQPAIHELRNFIETSRNNRLTPADEQKETTLFKVLVTAGGKALSGALELIGDLPWFIPVNGILEAWPELTPTKQRNFLSALKSLESEAARRMRFSIVRGLYRVDPASALKLLMIILQMNRTENGVDLRDRQVFCNVLIGKNKPWLLQIDLKALKPAEAKLLVLTAIEASVEANPPAAMAVIRWAKPLQTLIDLPEPVQRELAKGFRKWNARWQKELAVEELPPVLNEVVQAKLAKALHAPPLEKQLEQQSKPTPCFKEEAPASQPQPSQQQPRSKRGPDSGNLLNQKQNRQQRSKGQCQEKPAPQTQRRGSDISDLLRQIESQFNDLYTELQTAKNQLKQVPSQPRQRGSAPYGSGNREIAKLREENAQLAETIRALRETLSELATEDFDEAISRKADTDAPVTDPLEQYKSLLTLRLKEQIVNFQELNRENHIDGLPLLLDNMLHTLQENGIDLTNIETPPPPVKRRY